MARPLLLANVKKTRIARDVERADIFQNVHSIEASYGFLTQQREFIDKSFPNVKRISFDGTLYQVSNALHVL